jgi:hypothetical protein
VLYVDVGNRKKIRTYSEYGEVVRATNTATGACLVPQRLASLHTPLRYTDADTTS